MARNPVQFLKGMSPIEFQAQYGSEEQRRQAVIAWRWPGGFVCPHCGEREPWGNVYSITGTAVLDARLPGQWFQLESGLHYNWYRHYDPTLGRYTQPDPLGFVDGPSVYGYVGGSPQQATDQDGRYIQYICRFAPGVCATMLFCLKNPKKCKDFACRQRPGGGERYVHYLYKSVCSVPGCNGSESAECAKLKIGAAYACIYLMKMTTAVCFNNVPDPNHKIEEEKAKAKIRNCKIMLPACYKGDDPDDFAPPSPTVAAAP